MDGLLRPLQNQRKFPFSGGLGQFLNQALQIIGKDFLVQFGHFPGQDGRTVPQGFPGFFQQAQDAVGGLVEDNGPLLSGHLQEYFFSPAPPAGQKSQEDKGLPGKT